MATNYTSSSNPRTEKMGDVLDALSSGIAKTAAREPARVKVVVASVMQPTFEYRDQPNASL